MDRRITSRLNMANAFMGVCDANPTAVALVPAFAPLVAALKNRITALNAVVQRLSANTSGLYEDKLKWRTKLSQLLAAVCGAGVAYAKSINDVVLEGNFSFAESTLFGMRDTELIQAANSLIALEATVAAHLLDYGITSTLMKEVTNALENFEETNPKPIINVYVSEADRAMALKMAFELSEFVLENMMKAALIYKMLNLNFYQALENSSRISQVGIRHEEYPEATVAKKAAKDAATQQAVTEKKEVQDAPSVSELLGINMREINATSKNIETPSVQEPSKNGL